MNVLRGFLCKTQAVKQPVCPKWGHVITTLHLTTKNECVAQNRISTAIKIMISGFLNSVWLQTVPPGFVYSGFDESSTVNCKLHHKHL